MGKLSLLEGEFVCCGALCPKHEVQKRIDAMQSVIDRVDLYFRHDVMQTEEFRDLLADINALSTN